MVKLRLPQYAEQENSLATKPTLQSSCTAALPFQGDAFRVVYAVQLADEIWVVHAFQKKSTQGIKTPQREIDLIKDRLKRLKEAL